MKSTRGGRRRGAGRKPGPKPIEQHTITFYRSDVEKLRRIDPNLTKAIRKLVESST